MIRLLADALFGAIVLMWLALAGWHVYRYLRPSKDWPRRPQTLSIAAACVCSAAFVALVRGWLPHVAVSGLEAVAIVGGALAVVGVYLYEMQGPSRRRKP